MMVRIVVSGALGRMGKRIIDLAGRDPDFEFVCGIELDAHPELDIVSDLRKVKKAYDCIIEFTTPLATCEHVKIAKEFRRPIVIGTTGLSQEETDIIKDASRRIPIVLSPNMSVGVNVFFSLIEKAATILGKGYSVKIKEAHHVRKKDKPSGTAKFMENLVKKKLGQEHSIPIQSVREGEIVGDHDIFFESPVDVLRISHSAKTRDIFALGALRAARFVIGKTEGLYSMADVLAMKER
jgi:4-hydroxy-tetrahydrodipicolinate reductase